MDFNSRKEIERYTKTLPFIGMGSQGECFLRRKDNTVIKIFHTSGDEYFYGITEEDVMQFSHIKNDTFIWPTGVVRLGDLVVGYISAYVKSKNLYTINPLLINLNELEKLIKEARKDIKLISNHGVLTYDVMYNTMLGKKLYIIDQVEYAYRPDEDPASLLSKNNFNLDHEIYNFLIDTFFGGIVEDDKQLTTLYRSKKEDVLEFMKLFRRRLSELIGHEIVYLKDAQKLMDTKKAEPIYLRKI